MLNWLLFKIPLGKGNLIFCCTSWTDPTFWQIKIIIILISNINFSFFDNLDFFYDIFLLGHNKQYKIQKFNAREIVQLQSTGMWSVSYLTWAQVS